MGLKWPSMIMLPQPVARRVQAQAGRQVAGGPGSAPKRLLPTGSAVGASRPVLISSFPKPS